jgi:hypothetical protein
MAKPGTIGRKNLTWASIDRLRFPIWVGIVIHLGALQRSYWFIVINQRITTLPIYHEACNDAADSVRAITVKMGTLSGTFSVPKTGGWLTGDNV